MEIFQWLLLRGLLEASTLQKKNCYLSFMGGGGGCNLFNDLYREVGITLVEVYGKMGKSVI